MKRIVAATIALVASVLFAAAQSAKEPYAPGLGEFMTATQLRHAKLWFAGNAANWPLADYEIGELGEGFDDARLDTLFLAMPISWKGTLQQYVGRLHRIHDGIRIVQVYDYADVAEPMLARMYVRRRKNYASIGYELIPPPIPVELENNNATEPHENSTMQEG